MRWKPGRPAATAVKAPAEPQFPDYQAKTPIDGTLRAVGSDTMDHLMVSWSNAFRKLHPRAAFEGEFKGSSTAMPALLQDACDFGPMSRALKPAEITAFKDRFGYEPTQVPVAVDTLAVYLHPTNPLTETGLSLRQVDAIFSVSRNQDSPNPVHTWGDLGLTGAWANQAIKVYSRNSASGTYAFFREKVLLDGQYKPTNTELPSSEQVVRAVADDASAIGFSGIGYAIPQVVAAPLRETRKSTFIAPTRANAYAGAYPLTRNLYLTLNVDPAKGLSPAQREYLSLVFSKQGQDLVKAQGFYPLAPATLAAMRAQLKL